MLGLIRTQPPNAGELDRELAAILGGAPALGKGVVRAAGYTRVSSFMQVEDGNSLDDQAARIARFVAEHGWELVEVFADPARRDSRGRVWRPADFRPDLGLLLGLADRREPLGLKLGPALPHALVPAGLEAEWVSHRGDVVEAGLWSGPSASAGSLARSR